ncbi:MAG: hypothetical protein M1115_05020 [Actinobacteria bacterium]|nr:hypothetical protein [Actinomycetota bacterium]
MSILNPAGTFFAVLIGSSKPLGLAFWSTVLLVLTAYELAGHLRLRGVWTLEEVVHRYFHHRLARAAAVAVWLYAGWHLFSH